LADLGSNDKGSGALEAFPLAVGAGAIAIPVGLIAAACATESVVLLVLAVISMLCVGAVALLFIGRLASEGHEPDADELHGA
jgi:hypothetical protein